MNTQPKPQSEMTFGDHLEELRRRLILSLVGIAVALTVTLYFGDSLVLWLQQPLHRVQRSAGLPAMTIGLGVATGFTVYVKVAVVAAGILASPWILWQAWRFVAIGLYKSEQRVVMILTPFSTLMTSLGVLFAYYIMLPISLAFFITFSTSLPNAGHPKMSRIDRLIQAIYEQPHTHHHPTLQTHTANTSAISNTTATPNTPSQALKPSQLNSAASNLSNHAMLPILIANPKAPVDGQIWIDQSTGELKLYYDGRTRSVPLATGSIMSPMIEINEYISFVLFLAIGVIAAFQTPLVMFITGWAGLLDPAVVARYRKHCIFVCAVAGAVLTPSDPISMIVLAVPLYVLFEIGLILMRLANKFKSEPEDFDDSQGPDDPDNSGNAAPPENPKSSDPSGQTLNV